MAVGSHNIVTEEMASVSSHGMIPENEAHKIVIKSTRNQMAPVQLPVAASNPCTPSLEIRIVTTSPITLCGETESAWTKLDSNNTNSRKCSIMSTTDDNRRSCITETKSVDLSSRVR